MLTKEPALKGRLTALAAQGFELPDAGEAFPLLDEYLECLGSLDPELRDSLFYEAADSWIGSGLLDQRELSHLAARLVSKDFLFKGIGESAGNDVFRRTFSALILDTIVRYSNATGAGDAELIASIAASMERYARDERDLRGYVASLGWAHSVAHGADVLASLMAAPELSGWDDRILASTRELLLKSESVYTHQEDKRLARILLAHSQFHRDRRPELLSWIDDLMKACPVSFGDMEVYARRTNLLGLLRALYFYLHRLPEQAELASIIESRVRVLMRID